MKDMQLVILMGGKATRLAPLSYSLPKGLLTINSKPAIFNMMSEYIKRGLSDIIFVVSPSNESIVKSFVEKSFEGLKVKYVVQNDPKGLLHAFQLCKDYITKPTLLLLGDTLCEADLDYSYDWLGYMTISDNSHSRWCLIKTNSNEDVTGIIDKPDYTPETNKVLIGLYNFRNPAVLKECLSKNYELHRGELQLSSMIEEYSKKVQMKGLLIKSWYDTGTLRDYNQTMAKNIAGRSFNRFRLDEFGVLTKESEYGKLKTEIKWLDTIQHSDLAFLIPQFFGYTIDGNKTTYKTEMVNGKTLTEYFNFYEISEDNWAYIFDKLLKTGCLMWSRKAPEGSPDIKELSKYMYITKTLDRIKEWERQDILEKEYIFANGEKLLGFNGAFKKLENRINKLVETSQNYYSIIHGDICFSNVIYFPETNTFKFIDPRGNFGVDTIYGDSRYDVAKTRHNYHGLYDYITLDMFKLKEKAPDDFEYSFFTGKMINPILFDNIVEKYGYNIDDIELIEGLLFISMIPLHSEDKEAQIMYYITGLKCLNNQIEKEETTL